VFDPFNDNGVDGRAGTADDRPLTFYGIPNAQAGNFPITETQMNVDQYSRYKTIEVSVNKRYASRWSGSAGFGYTMMADFPNGPQRNPNNPGVEDRTIWTFKASGSYDAAWGIRISPVLRHQSGPNYARTVTISAPAALALTATSSQKPVINKEWISPGAHINAIGTHSPNSREIDSATMAAARIFVDRRESALNEAGDYLLAANAGLINADSIVAEIGELLIGTKSGRTSADEITLFKSLGLAIEDVACAEYLYQKALSRNFGTWVNL